jgi:hypothetical protein
MLQAAVSNNTIAEGLPSPTFQPFDGTDMDRSRLHPPQASPKRLDGLRVVNPKEGGTMVDFW